MVSTAPLFDHTKSKMSASDQSIQRFNKYKSLCDNAASACIRSFLHIVRPTEGFPYHSNSSIQSAWAEWKDAAEVFYKMTGIGTMPNYIFPTPPPDDAEHRPCRQMWGCLVQEQVERQDFQAPLIKDAVVAIMGSEACKSHPATCACKVPLNPWTWHECVAALEPLGIKHNAKCQCGGYQICKQKLPSAEELARTRVANMMVSAMQQAESEIAEKPWLKVGDCRCDAQYSAASCSCLPGRVAEAKVKYSLALAAEDRASSVEKAQTELDAKPVLKGFLEPCYCEAVHRPVSCVCLPGRVHRAKEKLKDKAAEAVGGGLEAAKKGEATSFLSLFRSRAPEPVAMAVAAPKHVSAVAAVPVPAALTRQSNYDYQHHVDSCPCGTCHKARVDSGTQEAYTKKCQEKSDAALKRLGKPPKGSPEEDTWNYFQRAKRCSNCNVSRRGICVECYMEANSFDEQGRLKMPSQLDILREGYHLSEPYYLTKCGVQQDEPEMLQAIATAKAITPSILSEDFAKNLFAAMGTPHDSKCPHGSPFYACMSCSH